MDTSLEYIKQCDCPEIQALAPRKKYVTDLYAIGDSILTYDQYRPEESRFEAIWLPRQDQLQEMVIEDLELPELIRDCQPIHNKIWNMLSRFYVFAREVEHQFTSMEQLWLAFVMKELHNKVWDGDRWVTQEKPSVY